MTPTRTTASARTAAAALRRLSALHATVEVAVKAKKRLREMDLPRLMKLLLVPSDGAGQNGSHG
jgi:hypothetical protein